MFVIKKQFKMALQEIFKHKHIVDKIFKNVDANQIVNVFLALTEHYYKIDIFNILQQNNVLTCKHKNEHQIFERYENRRNVERNCKKCNLGMCDRCLLIYECELCNVKICKNCSAGTCVDCNYVVCDDCAAFCEYCNKTHCNAGNCEHQRPQLCVIRQHFPCTTQVPCIDCNKNGCRGCMKICKICEKKVCLDCFENETSFHQKCKRNCVFCNTENKLSVGCCASCNISICEECHFVLVKNNIKTNYCRKCIQRGLIFD